MCIVLGGSKSDILVQFANSVGKEQKRRKRTSTVQKRDKMYTEELRTEVNVQ